MAFPVYTIKNDVIPRIEISGGEGRTEGCGRLLLWVGWEFEGVAAMMGSTSHGETLSGRGINEGSSH